MLLLLGQTGGIRFVGRASSPEQNCQTGLFALLFWCQISKTQADSVISPLQRSLLFGLAPTSSCLLQPTARGASRCLPSPLSSSSSCQSYCTSVKWSRIRWSTLTLTRMQHSCTPRGRVPEQMWCPPPHTHRCVFSNPRRHYQPPLTVSLTRGGFSLLVKMTIQSQQEKHSAAPI